MEEPKYKVVIKYITDNLGMGSIDHIELTGHEAYKFLDYELYTETNYIRVPVAGRIRFIPHYKIVLIDVFE